MRYYCLTSKTLRTVFAPDARTAVALIGDPSDIIGVFTDKDLGCDQSVARWKIVRFTSSSGMVPYIIYSVKAAGESLSCQENVVDYLR